MLAADVPHTFTLGSAAPNVKTGAAEAPPSIRKKKKKNFSSKCQTHSYLQTTLHQLVDVQEGLLNKLKVRVQYSDNALSLQDKESLRSVPTMHHGDGLPQTAQHLLGTVAVVFVFPW